MKRRRIQRVRSASRSASSAAKKPRRERKRVLGIEIENEDVVIEIETDQSVYAFVEKACEEWLVNVRDYDGEVHEHLWTVKTGEHEIYGPIAEFSHESFDEDQPEQVFSGEATMRMAFPEVGCSAEFNYDMGSPSRGTFRLKYEKDAGDGVTYPRVVETTSAPFPPPLDVETTADDMFPNLSAMLFGERPEEDDDETPLEIQRWVMFRSTKDTMALMEPVQFGVSDVLFAPAPGHRYRSAADLFRAVDYACDDEHPLQAQHDPVFAVSRFVFSPDPMPAQHETKLTRARNAPRDPFDMPILFLRESVASRDAALADIPFDDVFPRTTAAFCSDLWFEYKPRKKSLKICRGRLRDRDVIPHSQVLATISKHPFTNLHALLSAVEGLWPEE